MLRVCIEVCCSDNMFNTNKPSQDLKFYLDSVIMNIVDMLIQTNKELDAMFAPPSYTFRLNREAKLTQSPNCTEVEATMLIQVS